MIRRLLTLLVGIFATPAIAEPPCFDLAVVATSPAYKWLPSVSPPGPGDIILSSPARVSFVVEETLIGEYRRSHIQVVTSLHTRYNHKIRNFLLLLKRQQNGQFHLVDMNIYIVRLANGGYAMPLTGPLEKQMLQPDGYISADYQEWTTRLSYAASEAWWLSNKPTDDQEQLSEDFPWAEVRRDRIIAPRGLATRVLIDMMLPLRCSQRSRPK